MKEKIEEILSQVHDFQAESKEALENFRITYLSKKGIIPALLLTSRTWPQSSERRWA